MTLDFYDKVSMKCSRLITKAYSTSFSLGILCFDPKLRDPIYSIYGFVRFADEIVDTFQEYDKAALLKKFKEDTYKAIDEKISLNPVLHNFQKTVNKYKIEEELIEQFLKSMEMDLFRTDYNHDDLKEYIMGSAEVVGLMCLRVFCKHGNANYEQLKPFAMSLGSAFQKVNFLRDMKADYEILGRTYFPKIDISKFNSENKSRIEKSIEKDFKIAFKGIKQLPASSRLGVYLAYVYYLQLFNKIRKTPPHKVIQARIRIPNQQKFSLLCTSYIRHRLNIF